MKFLIKKMGWEKFKAALDEERKQVVLPASVNDDLKDARQTQPAPSLPTNLTANPNGVTERGPYREWLKDNVVAHRFAGYQGVNVRLKLGDLITNQARGLAEIAKTFSRGELRISIHQNLFLPWVPEKALPALYDALSKIHLSDSGAETLEDTTTCPGADTCRLGITSAKGLGAHISEAMHNGLSKYRELARDIKVKISGCPNGCAQHGVANIGFQGAALMQEGKTVPAHELFVGGSSALDETAFGERIGKFPAANCGKVVETLVELYAREKKDTESFNATMSRIGKDKIRELLASLAVIPSFDQNPEFYKDWGHENEKFAIRTGIKGECAGAPVQEKVPMFDSAKEHLAQAEAFLAHKEFASAHAEAYEAIAYAARVPLYAVLVDPFTSEQAIWEFENIFVRSGRSSAEWLNLSEKLEASKKTPATESSTQNLIGLARSHIAECERLHTEILQSQAQKV